MENIKRKHCGSIEGKQKMSLAIEEFKHSLAVMALVTERGARKYSYYSWQNSPIKSDATPENNFDALIRHFISHTMGRWIDLEGLPHIFHMICRASFLITSFYRRDKNYYLDKIKLERNSNLKPSYCNFGHQITSEMILALNKKSLYTLPDSLEECIPFIHALITKISLNKSLLDIEKLEAGDIYNTCFDVEHLFLVIFTYAEKLFDYNKKSTNYNVLAYMYEKDFAIEDKEFLKEIFGIDFVQEDDQVEEVIVEKSNDQDSLKLATDFVPPVSIRKQVKTDKPLLSHHDL